MTAVSQTSPRHRTRPHWAWFLLCPLIVVAGIVLGVRAGIDEARHVKDSFHLLGDGGVGTVHLDAGDEPTVYAVWPDGRSTDGLQRPPATVSVVGPGDDPVDVHVAGGNKTTFSFGNKAGINLASFRAPRDGRYAIAVHYTGTPDAVPPTAGIAELHLGHSFRRVLRPIGLSVIAALALMFLLFFLRSQDGRRRKKSAATVDRPASAGPISFN